MSSPRALAVAAIVVLLEGPAPAEIVTLTPDADTYIEVGTESTWDHGKCSYFDVDTKPWGVSYLRFDLTDLGEDEFVESAALTLRCSNSSNDGGRIHGVWGTSWVEGDRCGPGGFGLGWEDVDCNGDGRITGADQACSAFAPDFSRAFATLGRVASGVSYTRDVTEAFQYGPGVYTLAIVNDSSDGATYRSREYSVVAQRPVLQLDLAARPPNDRCGNPTVITSTDFTENVDTRGAPSYDDWDPYPICVGQPAPFSVWYSYTPASYGMVTITTEGSTYDTGVAVYVGTCRGDEDTMLNEVACAADACFGDSQPSRVAFYAEAGTTYLIMVWDEGAEHPSFGGGGGTLVFHLAQVDGCEG